MAGVAAPRLTVDLGNSSAKLRLWSQREAPARGLAVESPHDPALARAIDLLKGLSVVQQFRSI